MPVDKSLIGSSTGRSRITIERGPVSNFAKAVTDESPIYQTVEAAKAAGFENIPAPPTYPFAMAHWGTFPEEQPDALRRSCHTPSLVCAYGVQC
jgi:hypothetical protein